MRPRVRTPAPAEIDAFLTARFLAHAPASLLAMIEVLHRRRGPGGRAGVGRPAVGGRGRGAGRRLAGPHEQRAMAERLGARLVELPEAGHSPAVDDPEATADAIASLLP